MAVPSNFSYPAGGTWFDTLKRSFVDVPVDASKDNAISTTEFLEASESLTTLFGMSALMCDCAQADSESKRCLGLEGFYACQK